MLTDRPALTERIAASLAASGWTPHRRSLAAQLASAGRGWPTGLGAVVAAGADPLDLAEVVDGVRRDDRTVPVVVLAERPDGDLLGRLVRSSGGDGAGIGYGTTADDAAHLLDRAVREPGCTTSGAVAAALLERLGSRHRDHDLELAAALLTGGGRQRLVEQLRARPDLLAAVVDDAAGRALKRLALDATAEDRRWLAVVLDG